jgi:hypothetical protein
MAIAAQHTKFESHDYISPIPAEDLIKVALKKQEMYDEGKKQIKQAVSKYEEMGNLIINENERNYYFQEMDKMAKNIQQNAGLDFANMNNVEAVINLGKPFENDEYIKTALDNGIEYQRRNKELSSVPKDKRSADNDLVYMQDINDHISKGGLGNKLQKNKTYTQYVDVSEKMAAAEKEVQGTVSSIYTKGGKNGVPLGYLEKVDIERKTRNEVYQRLMLSMTDEEKQQLQISAQAQMYRVGPDACYQTWVGSNKQEKLLANQTRKEAMQQLSGLNAIPAKQRTEQHNSDISRLENIIAEQEATIAAADSHINQSPDDFDINDYNDFFTRRFVLGQAERLKFEKRKTDLKEDKVYMSDLEHKQALSEISARGAQERQTAEFSKELEYNVQSGASLTTLKGASSKLGVLPASGAKSGQIANTIASIDGDATLSASVKTAYKTQLAQLQKTYEYAEANRGNSTMRVSITPISGGKAYTTSVDDFLGQDLQTILEGGFAKIEIKSHTGSKGSKTPEQIQEETEATYKGKIGAAMKIGGLDSASAVEKVFKPTP